MPPAQTLVLSAKQGQQSKYQFDLGSDLLGSNSASSLTHGTRCGVAHARFKRRLQPNILGVGDMKIPERQGEALLVPTILGNFTLCGTYLRNTLHSPF